MRYFSKKIIKNLKEAMENDNEFKKSLVEDKEICVLCGKHINGHGNNPFPLANEGKCCDECNKTKVIPARIKAIEDEMEEEEIEIDTIYHDASEDELRRMGVFGDDDKIGYDDDYTIEYEGEDEEAIEYDDDPNMDY